MRQKSNTRLICMVGLMAALVFVGTNIRIKIPAGLDGTMLHLGNVFCLLGGLLFGGVPGGLAAGIGSGLFDLLSEYAREAPITFINKFVMGFVAGAAAGGVMRSGCVSKLRSIFAAAAGSVSYCILYVAKTILTQRYINGLPWEGVWPVVYVKTAVTLTNGAIAVVISVLLFWALRPALARTGLLPRLHDETQNSA